MSVLEIEQLGFAVVPGVLGDAQIEILREFCARIESAGVSRRQSVFAIRGLLDFSEIQDLARSAEIRALVTPILGEAAFCVRGIFFDKTPDANWKVVWHQDLAVAVERRIETPRFGAWSEKAGVIHVQPPVEILEQMLTVRLHLDVCDAENGALRVVRGSHGWGKRESLELAREVPGHPAQTVAVSLGGVMLMRPLLWHASSPSQSPKHRRVIHLEFANANLPEKLRWKWKI